MKRSIMPFIAVVTGFILLLTSCNKDNTNSTEYHRVVLLYLAANNNLSSYASENIESVKTGYVPEEDSKDILLVYSHINGSDPVLLRIYKTESGTVQEDVVSNYASQNSTTPAVLKSVLEKVQVIFPAEEYGLILWSHGTGWLPEGYYENPDGFGVYMPDPYAGIVKSFGNEDGVEMEITDMCEAIPYHLSFIIFDCCLMGGIETAYEFKDKCDYIIASPAEILATGFPYDLIMEPLFTKSAPDLEEVCQLYYDFYNSQQGIYKSATIALYESDKIESLSKVCKTIFSNNRSKLESLDASTVQRYFRLNKHWFYDLSDVIKEIASTTEYEEFTLAIDKAVPFKLSTSSFLDLSINSYSGISTYIQTNGSTYLDNFYKGYKWNTATEMVK